MLTKKLHLSKITSALQTSPGNVKSYILDTCNTIKEKDVQIKSLLFEKNRKERLLSELEKLNLRFADENNLPPLFGVLVGIKDIVNVDGFKTQGGSNLPPSLFEGKEASLVTKLKDAGAIIVGKTVTTEFAYFEPGETRNPHNIEHTPGGSSSGSAAAVASGIVPLAIGTQTIGSIIRPASYCGIIGFKPSFDRIAKDGVIPFSISADHIGIFTQDIDGINIAASVLCDSWDKNTVQNIKPVIGAVKGKYLQQANNEVVGSFEKTLTKLSELGFTIKRIDPFIDIEKINSNHLKMNSAEFSEVHRKWFDKYKKLYREGTKELILKGKEVSLSDFYKALEGRYTLRNEISLLKKENSIDVWLSPSTTSPAPKGMATGSPLMNLPWTYAGLPSITIPIEKAKNGLPLGLQIVGDFYKDEEMIAYSATIRHKLGVN